MTNIYKILTGRSLQFSLIAITFGGMLLLQSCNNTTNISTPGPNGNGKIKINMTDTPANFEALTVNITSIKILGGSKGPANNQWQIISDSSQKVNLLNLTDGKTQLLGNKSLPAGTYTQIELILGPQDSVTVNGKTYPITIPSSQQSGIKINLNNVQLKNGQTFNLLLDFNAAQSIQLTGNGNYMMKPVIRAVNTQIDGYINGTIQPSSTRSVIAAINKQDTVSTISDTTNGNFKIMGVAPGPYSLSVVPLDTTYSDTTIQNVAVNSNDTTNVGTITLKKK